MKDLSQETIKMFPPATEDPNEVLERIEVGLMFIYRDEEKTIHCKVADDWDYEELIGVLISAKAVIENLRKEKARDEASAAATDRLDEGVE